MSLRAKEKAMNLQSKQRVAYVALLAAFGMTTSLPILAQQVNSGEAKLHSSKAARTHADDAMRNGRDMRASKIIGKNVENAQGENLGEVKDLIVDLRNQRIHYAVLGFGGALGLGDKLFAYPISSFKQGGDNDKLVLNVDKEKLKSAPGFDKDKWPDWSDKGYRRDVDRYFKSDAARAAPHSERFVRASDLIGKNIDDRNGKDAGEIEDLVVNMSSGRVSYAVVDFDKSWSPDDKLLPMPLAALTFPTARNKDAVLNVDRDRLDMARGFDEKNWPDLNTAEFRRNVKEQMAAMERSVKRAGRSAEEMTSSGASR
jgi:sporulation protein YlmC with PRC-barrel domain